MVLFECFPLHRRTETGIPAFESFQTPREPEPVPGPHVPAPVSNLTISNITPQSAQSQWLPSRDQSVQNYR